MRSQKNMQNQDVDDANELWHYTVGPRYRLMQLSGVLTAGPVPATSQRKPMIWFSSSKEYDPVTYVRHNLAQSVWTPMRLGMIDSSKCLPFLQACHEGHCTRDTRRRLHQKAEQFGANVSQWYAYVASSIPLEMLKAEYYCEDKKCWMALREYHRFLVNKHASSVLNVQRSRAGLTTPVN